MAAEARRGWNIGRDTAAGVFVAGALLLPWNLYFGFGVPGSHPTVFAALVVVTVLALGSIAVTYTGRRRIFGAHFHPALTDRLRLWLNIPYLLLVFGFVLFDLAQTIRYGGSAQVPGGVGPGGWLGIAGAVLAAQPVLVGSVGDDDRLPKRATAARGLAYASIIGAGLSVLFNLYWRIRYALSGSGEAAGFGEQQVAIIVTALVYGVVAWAVVVVAARWILNRGMPALIATTLLGASTLVAGVLVWILPAGRYIDGFHGIAQNTSTAGVGFEAYLVWAAAAATSATPALRPSGSAASISWPAATRKLLLLIVIWSFGSALMRGTDLMAAAMLGLSYSPYDSAAMAAFDLVTAALALWLYINLTNSTLPSAALWSTCAVLFGFTIARIVVGVGLAPRLPVSQRLTALANPVYGNGFAQQITSMFDVVLCGLALCALAITIVVARLPTRRVPSPRIFRRPQPTRPAPADGPKIFRPESSPTQGGRHRS